MTLKPRLVPSTVAGAALPVSGDPWLALWRTVWLDLPLAWAGEFDRCLSRGTPLGPAAVADRHAGAARTPAEAVALGLGCGDYAEEALERA
ncbi:hypothetical protein [Methylobacterium sp. NEAU K]|uniref:hypothetical protein n=1 Tax=Methylobacterium sp. NEAU K TaxID=3064946 RepID=UPI0027328836|nr:hypothetical protein [Methylobacterium sp. NEAU K]MDP4003337.1 hypothetical protein [Methylobacterium sp. NEAU K]